MAGFGFSRTRTYNSVVILQKKIDKLCTESLDWAEKNKGLDDISALELKISEVEEQIKPILDRLAAKISEAAAAAAAAASAANVKK